MRSILQEQCALYALPRLEISFPMPWAVLLLDRRAPGKPAYFQLNKTHLAIKTAASLHWSRDGFI